MKDWLHEIPKDTLMLKNIKYDLKQIYKGGVTAVLIFLSFSLFWARLAEWICEDAIYKIEYIVWLMPAMLFAISLMCLVQYIKATIKLNKKINIVSDWLVDITECTPHRRYSRPYYQFTFARYGKYNLYMGVYDKNYKWSKMYAMSNEGIYNYSQIDDDFYIVLSSDRKPQILLIYNKKLFELK